MLLNTFSMYRNFLNFDEDRCPEFNADFGAVVHLTKLYHKAVQIVEKNNLHNVPLDMIEVKREEQCDISGDQVSKLVNENRPMLPVRLIGFSKGCVVLNQIMFELKTFKEDPDVKQFLENIVAIYWLDGGHTGRQNAYITDYDILGDIVSLNKELFVHVTPYQVLDPNRPWIGIEEREFVLRLTHMKGKITEKRHFMSLRPSVKNHFNVIKQVKP